MFSFISLVASYLVGSIPVGFLTAKMRGIDIREHGSGNIGTTNVWRTLGPAYGIITFLGDVAKGAAAVFLGIKAGPPGWELLCGLAAIAGHSWPLYLRFQGGKIIATGLGVLIALSYKAALLALLVWVIVVGITRYISLGSMLAAISVPVWMFILDLPGMYLAFGILAAVFAVYKHRSNIKKIWQGNEFKVGKGKGKSR